MTNWVTVDKFSDLTGIHRDYALRHCRNDSWKENIAWRKLSDRIYLINLGWWDKWHETEAASKRRQNLASKSNSSMKESDAERELSASPRLPILED